MPDDVPEEEKTRRIVALQQLQRRIQWALHEQAVGRTVEVLVDQTSRRREWELSGRTTGNTVVNFPGDPCTGRTARAGHHSARGPEQRLGRGRKAPARRTQARFRRRATPSCATEVRP